MRIVHTADWHLGHLLHDWPRRHEHRRFLAWLLDRLEEEKADALIVAGDVFETANPPVDAQRDFYEFLRDAQARCPRLTILVVAGNHDSAARLEATDPLLDARRVRIVGGVPFAGGLPDADRLVVPLPGADGRPAAWCVAVPFLRAVDLPPVAGAGEPGGPDPIVEGARALYAAAVAAARARRSPGQPLVAVGHGYLVGGRVSDLSERRVFRGNQSALPAEVFPDDLAYVALGHLHLAQTVGGREHVRYAGSPIPLAFDERAYPHQVCVADLDGPGPARVRPLRVPRFVDLLRVPEEPAPLAAALEAVRALPARRRDASDPERPLLEVRVLVDAPQPRLTEQVAQAAADRDARLLRVEACAAARGPALADAEAGRGLRDLLPEEVLRRRWARDHEGEPPPEVLACFHDLLDAVARGEEAP
jgi:exonuclease SbcD